MARLHAQAGLAKTIQAGVLAWLLPGAGHWRLGQRGLAVTFFLAISIPFWAGLAVGGIKNCVNPWSNRWLFLAEMGIGGYTGACLLINVNVGDLDPRALADPNYLTAQMKDLPPQEADERLATSLRYMSFAPESEIAQIYLATAGLLNLLAILDALTRAQTGGLPTFYREMVRAAASGEGQS